MAPSVKVFAQLFGKALQAQARIALVNTTLTALGMWALAIPGLGLLSLFVFLCSFIPIAGARAAAAVLWRLCRVWPQGWGVEGGLQCGLLCVTGSGPHSC